MRRGLVIVFGMLLSGLAAVVFFASALIFEASHVPVDTALAWFRALAFSLMTLGPVMSGTALSAGLHVVWLGILIVCFAPVGIAAMVGEAAHSRSPVLFAGLTGVGTAALPTLTRELVGGGMPHAAAPGIEGDLTVILFLTGVLGGLVYWLVAGRSARAVDRVRFG